MKAVIFDMDGVLFLTETMGFNIGKKLAKVLGVEMTEDDYNGLMVGKRQREATISFLKAKGLDLSKTDEVVKDFISLKRETLQNRLKEVVVMRNHTKEMLEMLSKRYRICLATSTIREFAERLLNGFGIIDFFEFGLTAENVIKGKPDPEIYLKALKKLGLDAKDCVVVEDSIQGSTAAKGAGIKCIGIKTPEFKDRGLEKIADVVIEGFEELTLDLIESLS